MSYIDIYYGIKKSWLGWYCVYKYSSNGSYCVAKFVFLDDAARFCDLQNERT